MSAMDSLKKMSPATKGKVAFMCALLVIGMLLWGRLLLKHVPRTAIADPNQLATEVSVVPAEPASPMRALVKFKKPTPMSRDVFVLDASKYARVAKPEQPLPAVVEVVVPEKSRDERADEQERIREVQRAATALSLQSTVLGDSPRAVINGIPVSPGQKIRGFVLKKVFARSVVIEMNGVEIRLEM